MNLEQFLDKDKKMIVAKQNSSGSTDFKLPPPGSFLARLYRIIDIGTQTTEWMGKKKMQRKIICMFELHLSLIHISEPTRPY